MSRKFFKSLSHDFLVQKNGSKTSIYFENLKGEKSKKPLAVLIHGFGGSAFGMSFLAREMSKNWRILIVEMPNHGKSSRLKIENSDDLKNWNLEIINQIEQKFGQISILVCHSISSNSVSLQISKKVPCVLTNPVFETPAKYVRGTKFSANPFFATFSNFPLWSPFKAAFLIKTWKIQSVKNVFENMIFSFLSPVQAFSQAKMAKIPFEKSFFNSNSHEIKMLVVGKKDTLSEPLSGMQKEEFFPKAELFEVETGHLAPIEIPKVLAKKFEQFLPKK